MIIFHEGLPGSGKSFAAFKDHVIPRLREGRGVTCYVEGINHEQIAGIAGISLERCKEQLQVITRDQAAKIYVYVRKNDLVVIDEAQNFWPHQRKPLEAGITQFITEHRHLGVDVLLMGQVMGDVHSLWRGRVDRKLVFVKLDAVGAEQSYKWLAYKRMPSANGREKWQETGSGEGKYDPAYFGCYASHEPDVTHTENYQDKRFNLFNSRYFRIVLPVFGILAVIGAIYAWNFLHKGVKPDSTAQQAKGTIQTVQAPPNVQIAPPQVVATHDAPRVDTADQPPDMVERLSKSFRLRLLGTYSINGETRNGLIEWRAADNALVNRLTFREIEALGYSIFTNNQATIAYIAKGRVNVMAVSWSLKDDSERQAQDNRLQSHPATISTNGVPS